MLTVIALGALTGLLNGFLVEIAKIDAFIATLGTGTVLYALALWHTGGRQIVGVVPDGFYALNGTFVFGLPITGFYVLLIAVVLWLILEYTPIGRYLYAIGANPKAAALNGIPTRKFVVGAFVASGTLAVACALRDTSKVEPTLTSMRGGMRLTSRRVGSDMPTILAASAGLSVRGATQAVQLAKGPRWASRLRTKWLALS